MLMGVGHVGRQMIASGGAGKPSLDLSFNGPTLDPRLTFTRGSTATYFDATGTMQTVSGDAPRFDYDPVALTPNGLLIEEARTNMLPQSDTFTSWTSGNITKVTASGVAPDGTNTMIRQQEMATTNNHLSIMSPLPTIVAATIYTFSVYAMAQQNRYLQLVFDDNGANGVYANFDLQTGTISQPVVPQGAVTNAAAAMQNVGNGIYRCSVTCATNSTTTARPVIVLINAAAATKFVSYTGSIANGLLTWGAQFEAGAFPTSYVPTTGAAVTRAVDVLTIQPANMSPWFNAGPGSWMIAATSYPAAGAPRRLINYLSGTAVYPLLVTTAGYTLASFDGVATLTTANLISAGVPFAGASVWNTGGTGAVCLNGGAVVSAATQTAGFASLLTTGVKLMSDGGSTDTGYIRRLRYWPRVLSNTELQQVTA